MELIVFEKEAYYRMLGELMAMFQKAIKEAHQEALQAATPENDWISSAVAKKLLNIKSKSTLQKLRDEGVIRFSQFGRKILYSKQSIIQFINKNTSRW